MLMTQNILINLSIILCSIFFPILKIPMFIYFLKWHDFKDIIYPFVVSENVSFLFKSFSEQYFFWQVSVVFGNRFFLNSGFEWFTFLSIFYNFIVYQTIALSYWKKSPPLGILFISFLQYLDNTPFTYALLDNITTVYISKTHSPMIFIPEKILLFLFCKSFQIICG